MKRISEVFVDVIVLIVAVHLLGSSRYTAAAAVTDSSKFEILEIRTMWPPSDCLGVPGCTVPSSYNEFSLHVFAPAFSNGTVPVHCHDIPYRPDDVKPLYDLLRTYWPDFYNYTHPEAFWATQWSDHGTCSLDLEIINDQVEYFSAAMELRQMIGELEAVLKKCGIVPVETETFTIQEYDSCLLGHYHQQAAPHCRKYGSPVKKTYLHEIVFCFDVNMEPIDCPTAIRKDEAEMCGSDDIIMLPIP